VKKFLNYIILFSLGSFLFILTCISFFKLDENTDEFYFKFTTHPQSSLIIGTSRAAQGILPSILDSILNRRDLFNYAFTIAHSPFGESYYKSIKSKINSNSKNGIFIVTVDPWSVSSTTEDPNDSLSFQEIKLAVGATRFVNSNPNLLYLLKSYDQPFYNLFARKENNSVVLHKNGWLEVSVSMDTTSVLKRLKEKVISYNVNARQYKFSYVRWRYLAKTINLLKTKGDVYLVRLPMHEQIFEIEKKYMPEFETKIKNLSSDLKVSYYGMSNLNMELKYTDGNHLYKSSAKEVSGEIAKWIKNIRIKNE